MACSGNVYTTVDEWQKQNARLISAAGGHTLVEISSWGAIVADAFVTVPTTELTMQNILNKVRQNYSIDLANKIETALKTGHLYFYPDLYLSLIHI